MTDLLFDKKDVFSAINYEEAEKYIQKTGWFADSIKGLKKAIETEQPARLVDVFEEGTPFRCEYSEDDFCDTALFIPEENVHKEEKGKKWRPFTIDEFNKIFKIGHVIIFRSKDSDYHGTWLYTGWASGGDLQNRVFLYLGAHNFSLTELFDGYEYSDVVRGWCPFGVEVEE